MKKYKGFVILLNVVVLLVYFNYSVSQKEQILATGQLVLLKLAPVDPRSLMQGDYMALRYALSVDLDDEKIPKRGYFVVRLDSLGGAHRIRIQEDQTPLQSGEYLIGYTNAEHGRANLGAESYFFQEGNAEKYEQAQYGGLKIDTHGNSLLIGLYDVDGKRIE